MDEILKQLEVLRTEVKTWVSHAEYMIAGKQGKGEHAPVRPTECGFGRWYYNEGRQLERFPAYGRLGLPHDNQHILYQRIYNLAFDDGDSSTIGKILGVGKSLREEHLEEAAELLPHLQSVTKQLLELLDLLEDQVKVGYKAAKPKVEVQPSKPGSKYSEVSKMLDSLETEINEDLK